MNKLRRRLMILGGIALLSGYSLHRGLRYPRLSWEPSPLAKSFNSGDAQLELSDLLLSSELSPELSPELSHKEHLVLRAYAPEPELRGVLEKGEHTITITNLSPHAKLQTNAAIADRIEEQREGLECSIITKVDKATQVDLRWKLDSQTSYKFAVIGDTGGGDELFWSLKRASELKALFLLHLGDFNYSPGEYSEAIEKFHNSPLPVYVTIGNHDFHDDGLIYQQFRSEIGPMNHAFSIAGTQFINIDTAADFFPASGGLRGQLFSDLNEDSDTYSDRVFFTHRPLRDPRPHDDHVVGGIGEVDWLKHSILSLGGDTLLTGHVHHSAELEVSGIRQWTIGEGLGHENLVLQRPVAKMLLGEVAPQQKVAFRWLDLNLPWSMHTSVTHRKKLVRDKRHQQLAWYENLLKA